MTVSINPTHNGSARINGGQINEVSKTPPRQPPAGRQNKPAASTHFQASTATDTSKDIDHTRVAEIRQAISDGRLHLDPGRIADGIIASARELVSQSD